MTALMILIVLMQKTEHIPRIMVLDIETMKDMKRDLRSGPSAILKPNQYLMKTVERVPHFARGISKETRAWVLERNGYTCQMCGGAAGDPDPLGSSRTVRLTMGHIVDKSKGGDDSPQNLRAVCTNCNEGLQNTAPMKPDRVHLLAQVRRATIDDQRAVLDWMLKKFNLKIEGDEAS